MNQEILNLFSDNLNYWLKRRGKTQADLYKKMGVASSTASDWCNGHKMPKSDKLVDISVWLGIELSDLITKKERPTDLYNDIIFRLSDDNSFRGAVTDIFSFDDEKFRKMLEYIELLKK